MDIKELIQYLASSVKFWVIINEWQGGVHLRFGKIRRVVKKGMYLKLPIIDAYYVQSIRLQEISATQINAITKDGKDVTLSGSAWYVIDDVQEFYLGYTEPNEIVSAVVRSGIIRLIENTDLSDVSALTLEEGVMEILNKTQCKGFNIETFKLVTISKAKVIRLIKDDLYSQSSLSLDIALK